MSQVISFDALLDDLSALPSAERREALRRMLDAAAGVRKATSLERQAAGAADAPTAGRLLAEAGRHMLAGAQALGKVAVMVGGTLDAGADRAVGRTAQGIERAMESGWGQAKGLWKAVVTRAQAMFQAAAGLFERSRAEAAAAGSRVGSEAAAAATRMIERTRDGHADFMARNREVAQEVGIHLGAAYDLVVEPAIARVRAGVAAAQSALHENLAEPLRRARDDLVETRDHMVEAIAGRVAAVRTAAHGVVENYQAKLEARRVALLADAAPKIEALRAQRPSPEVVAAGQSAQDERAKDFIARRAALERDLARPEAGTKAVTDEQAKDFAARQAAVQREIERQKLGHPSAQEERALGKLVLDLENERQEVGRQGAQDAVDAESAALAGTGRTIRLDSLFAGHVADVTARVRAQEPQATVEDDALPSMGM
ncbi:MAG: hypothetical protein HKL99_10870 [Burkholderiales bacterium]|nr:hypothetical protein [Burkholderiales bacterium]